MRALQRFLAFVRIRPGDGRSAFLFGTYIGLAVGSAVLLTSYNDASFLAVYEATVLPYLFIASALALSAASIVFQNLSRRLPGPRLTLLTPLVFGLALLGLRFLEELPFDAITFAAYLVIAVICGLLLIVAWNYLDHAFDTRQLKRLMPIFGTAASFGAIAGGSAARFLTRALGAENLLLVAAAVLGLLVALTAVCNRRLDAGAHAEEEQTAGTETTRAGVGFIARHPVVRLVTLMMVCSVIVKIMVDYQFKTTLSSLYDREGMAAFLGSYYAIASGVTLGLQLLLSGHLLSRFGIGPALASRPTAVVALCVAALVHPTFGIYVALRFSDEVLNRGWYKAGAWLALSPLPAPRTARVKLMQDGMLEPLVVIFTSALLLLLTRLAGLPQLSWVALGTGLLWLLLGLRVRKNYIAELSSCLDKRLLDFENATALGGTGVSPETLDYLARQLREADPESVAFALRAAREMNLRELADEVAELLTHTETAVRSAAATTIVALLGEDAGEALRRQLMQEEAPPALAHLLQELAAFDDDSSLERVYELVDHESLEVRGAAIVLLFKRGGLDGIIAAAEQLGELRRGTSPERSAVARILGTVGVRHLDRTLVPLLEDPSLAVRRAALSAAGEIPSPAVMAAVTEMVDQEELLSNVEAALIAGRESAWQALVSRIEDQEDNVGLKRAAARVAAAVPSVAEPKRLLAWLETGDPGVRHEILLALSAVRKLEGELDKQVLAATFGEELGLALTIDALRSSSAEAATAGIDSELLDRELRIRLTQTQERLFQHLGLRHPPQDIYNAHLGVSGSDRRLRANALEYLDTILRDPHEKLLVAHLETASAVECYEQSREALALPELGADRWSELMRQDPSVARLLGAAADDQQIPTDTVEAALALARVPLLGTQSFENLCRLAVLASRRRLNAGDTLFQHGQRAGVVGVPIDGEFESETVSGEIETGGGSVGLLEVLAGTDHETTLRCLGSGTCLVIEEAPLREMLERYSSIAVPLIAALVARTRGFTEREAVLRARLNRTREGGGT